jgi:hypothetical protein
LDGTAGTFFKVLADFGGYRLTGANRQLTLMDMVGFPGFSTLLCGGNRHKTVSYLQVPKKVWISIHEQSTNKQAWRLTGVRARMAGIQMSGRAA